MLSKLWSLEKSDWVKGLYMAVSTAVITALYSAVSSGGFSSIQWSDVGHVAILATLTYLLKQFSSDHNGAVLGLFGGRK